MPATAYGSLEIETMSDYDRLIKELVKESFEELERLSRWSGDARWKGDRNVECSKEVNGRSCRTEVKYKFREKPYCGRHYPPDVAFGIKFEVEEQKQQEKEFEEQSRIPGATDYPDTTFNVREFTPGYRQSEMTGAHYDEEHKRWEATVTLYQEETSKYECDLYITFRPDQVQAEIRTMRQYHRTAKHGPWKERYDNLYGLKKDDKLSIKECIRTLAAWNCEISYLQDRPAPVVTEKVQ